MADSDLNHPDPPTRNRAKPKCEVCGEEHGHLIIHSRCHIKSPTWVWLNQDKGTLEVRCAECDKYIVTFATTGPIQ